MAFIKIEETHDYVYQIKRLRKVLSNFIHESKEDKEVDSEIIETIYRNYDLDSLIAKMDQEIKKEVTPWNIEGFKHQAIKSTDYKNVEINLLIYFMLEIFKKNEDRFKDIEPSSIRKKCLSILKILDALGKRPNTIQKNRPYNHEDIERVYLDTLDLMKNPIFMKAIAVAIDARFRTYLPRF